MNNNDLVIIKTKEQNWIARIKLKLQKQNNQQYITILTSFITELISITISNLTLWFIPQKEIYSYTILLQIPMLEWYLIILISCNIITWVGFVLLGIYEIKREYWLVKTFDYSRRYSSLHLTKYKKDYPELFINLETFNQRYYKFYQIIKWMLYCNIICSSIVIIYSGYSGYQTITTLFTNFWISYTKITKGINIARESIHYGIGYSYYNTQSLSFNRIDARIKKHISNSNINITPDINSVNGVNLSNSRVHSRRASASLPASGNGSANASLNASWNGSLGNEDYSKSAPIIHIDEFEFFNETDIDLENFSANHE